MGFAPAGPRAGGTPARQAVSVCMLATMEAFLDRLLGLELDASELEFRHMAWRAFVVFGFAVFLARVGARRMLSQSAGFDIMVAVILGSVLSRGINGQSEFFPSLGAGALLVALHHALATLAFRFHWVSELVKGRAQVLVKDGQVDRREMARCKITDDDLDENLRMHGNVSGTGDVAEARLERNGAVSVVRARRGATPPEIPGSGQ
jgi:uncharacterized membrane protein YcaP (DUF421 family)